MERIRHELQDWAGELKLAGIFGSAARRDGDEDSDIDLLVVSDSTGLDEMAERLAERIRTWTGNDAQVIGLRSADLDRLLRA